MIDAHVVITPWSSCAIGGELFANGATLGGATSVTWPVASTALFYPFSVATPFTATKIMWANGAAVSGNVDAGVYDSTGVRVGAIGSTAQAGVSATQSATLSLVLNVGTYYLALVLDNTTGTFMRRGPGIGVTGWAQIAAAFPLPATVTLATGGTAYQPAFGLTSRSFV